MLKCGWTNVCDLLEGTVEETQQGMSVQISFGLFVQHFFLPGMGQNLSGMRVFKGEERELDLYRFEELLRDGEVLISTTCLGEEEN